MCGHEFVSEALSNRLDSSQSLLSGDEAQLEQSNIDSSERADIDCLSLGNTTLSDSGGVFSWSALADSINDDLEWVKSEGLVDDIHGILDDSESLDLLTSVSALEHQTSDKALDDWALGLSESLALVSTGSVRDKDLALGGLDSDIVFKSLVWAVDSLVFPLTEEFWHSLEASVFELYVSQPAYG